MDERDAKDSTVRQVGKSGKITNLFLRAKHWQIFAVLVGLPALVVFRDVPRPIHFWRDLGPAFFFVIVSGELWFACFLGWLVSISRFARSIVTVEPKMKMGFLRFAFVYPMVYALAFPPLALSRSGFAGTIILPLHLLCMFCILYIVCFASKNLVLANIEKPGPIFEYARAFCLLWFYPFGLWIIQPKINQIFAERSGLLHPVEQN